MNRKFKAVLNSALVMLLVLSVMPVLSFIKPTSAIPADDVAMWIEPASINLETANPAHTIGYRFNVTVWAKSNVTVSSWEFKLVYPKAYLNATGCGYTAGSTSEFFAGKSTIPVSPAFGSVNATHDYVLHAETILSAPYREPGYGSLAWVEFEVIAVPDKGQTIHFYLDIDDYYPTETYILDEAGNKLTMALYNCEYTFTWSAPPSPYLGVDPTSRFYDRYTEWVGTTFTEDIYLYDLAAAWYLTNVSFTLSYDTSFLDIVGVTFNPAWDVATTYTLDEPSGTIDIYVETSAQLSGDVLIATLTFNITDQGTYPDVYTSDLAFSNEVAYDHTMQIPLDPSVPGQVTVEGYLAVHMPHLEVVPNEVVFGPEPVVGKEFTVSVDIKRLHFAWKLVGVQFRMTYCDDMLEVVKVEEGDFFKPFAPYGTFFQSYVEPDYYGPHILVGSLILPNTTNGVYDQFPPYPGAEWGQPGENGTIATITFRITKQLGPDNLTCIFGLFDILMLDVNGDPVPFDPPVNGTYTCLGLAYMPEPRQIDLYGGAVNRGYGKIPFPAPYGGQGANATMDMVAAQSEVTLFANVTYHGWPEQFKTVTFEIIDPYGATWAKLTALTDENGVATITFRMPWTCENATAYFGEWTVIASTEVADVKIFDYLWFKYDYLVNIWKVFTDKYYYEHYETVEITVEYGTYAEEAIYPGVITVTILDETGVPIGYAELNITIGGATYCSYYNVTVTLTIYIPKWARAGYAYVHVSILDADPAKGGSAWCPEYVYEIYILPEP